jgi:hypothetical protein
VNITVLKKNYPPRAVIEALGFIPEFLNDLDPRPAREQFNESYAHGGGWRKFDGFEMDPKDHGITYPGDPTYMPLASLTLRDETIFIYPHAWVAIVQPDGTYEIARMD